VCILLPVRSLFTIVTPRKPVNSALVGSTRVELVQGDITGLRVDAIVNAANAQLRLGGGVAGAIRCRGGPSIQQECDVVGGCPVGGAVATGAGDLPARRVIHAVGPRAGDGLVEAKLRSATLAAIHVAEREGLSSVAFPAISAGAFGVPLETVARAMLSAAVEHLRKGSRLGLVVFCLFDAEALAAFGRVLAEVFASGGP